MEFTLSQVINQAEHHQTSMDPRLSSDHQPDAPLPAGETPAAPSPGSRMFSGLVRRTHFYFQIPCTKCQPWRRRVDGCAGCAYIRVLSASNHLGQINFSYLIFPVDIKNAQLCVYFEFTASNMRENILLSAFRQWISCFSKLRLTLRWPFRFPLMNQILKTRDMTNNWWLLW